MAKFNFKLQSLLNVKEQLENNLKNMLGKAVMELQKRLDRLSELEKEKEGVIRKINSGAEGGITVAKLKKYNSYLSYVNEKIDFQKEKVNEQQKVVDKYREELVKAMQERKMFEKLKEKKFEEFLKEEEHKEQRIIDETVSYKNNPNSGG